MGTGWERRGESSRMSLRLSEGITRAGPAGKGGLCPCAQVRAHLQSCPSPGGAQRRDGAALLEEKAGRAGMVHLEKKRLGVMQPSSTEGATRKMERDFFFQEAGMPG